MKSLADQTVFTVGGVDYRWEDVILAAESWGDWPRLVARTRLGLELLGSSEDEAVTDDELEAAASEFRYARDLVTAEEMEAWLERWGLDIESWMLALHAALLRRKRGSELPSADASPEDEEEPDGWERALAAEAATSGDLSRFAERLAGRAALFQWLVEDGQAEPPDPGDRPRLLARLEESFQALRTRLATPEALAERIKSRRADWTSVTTRVLRLSSEDAAREALLSIREDGETLEAVARDAKTEVEESRAFLEDVEPALRDRLMSARPGDMVGPLAVAGGVALFLVVEKRTPSLDDAAPARRAEESLLAALTAREVDNRVKWHWKL